MFADRPVLAGVWHLDGDLEVHGHDFIEIALIGHGSGCHLDVRGRQSLSRGDLVVLRPGAWHGFVDCFDLEVANCCLSAQALDGPLSFLYADPSLRRLLWSGPVLSGRQGTYGVRIPQQAAVAGVAAIRRLAAVPHAGLALLGQLLSTLAVLVEALPDRSAGQGPHASANWPANPTSAGPRTASGTGGAGAGVAGLSATPPVIRELAGLMAAGPERPWRLAELADVAALDPDYLARLFRQHLGVSPMAYLARIRVERAAHLLARTDEPIARVGILVGWTDPTYFARRFRQLTGLTPSRYRGRARGMGAALPLDHRGQLGQPQPVEVAPWHDGTSFG